MALFRFHWGSGARVALRANAAVLGIVVFVFGSAPDALPTLRHFILGVVSFTPSNGARIVVLAICAALALTAAPRVTLGASGWMRSLPIDARASRRVAVAAISVAQMFVPAAIVIVSAGAAFVYRAPLSWSRVLAIVPMVVGVAGAVLPRQSLIARAFCAGAAAAAVVGTWPAIPVSVVLLGLSDRIGRDVHPIPARVRARPARPFGSKRARTASRMWAWSSWRAIGVRRLVDAAFVPVIPLAFAYFIVRNNDDLGIETVHRVVRVCGAMAILAVIASLSNALLRRRRPWPWARSLPWSASRRIVVDAFVVGLPALAAPIVLFPLSWSDCLALFGLIPIVAVIGAATVRSGATQTFGATGRCILLATPIAIAVIVWPPLAIAMLALTPAVLGWAARLEMNTGSTAWIELQHDAAGDPYWLSRP